MYGHALYVKRSKNRTQSQRPRNIFAKHVPGKEDARRKAQMSQSYAWECGAERLTRDTSTSITRKPAGTSPLMCLCLETSSRTCSTPTTKNVPGGSQRARWAFAVTRERNEVDNGRDIARGKPTARWLAPQATKVRN